ncbi:hypothetical protein F4774DRAFT_365651 [Daldinia eschscholtzii]|nr:hypothetical protein F4774DRAFT_365651 [Daldinia eschscholtzii]
MSLHRPVELTIASSVRLLRYLAGLSLCILNVELPNYVSQLQMRLSSSFNSGFKPAWDILGIYVLEMLGFSVVLLATYYTSRLV